jgi:hypothetical protein
MSRYKKKSGDDMFASRQQQCIHEKGTDQEKRKVSTRQQKVHRHDKREKTSPYHQIFFIMLLQSFLQNTA